MLELPARQKLDRCPRCETPFFRLDGEVWGACSSCYHVWSLKSARSDLPVFPVPFPNDEKSAR